MILVFYHPEQNALRLYDTEPGYWVDMREVFISTGKPLPIQNVVDYGFELVGEFTYWSAPKSAGDE